MARIRVPRRTFLRGLGGTAIGLPLLEAMTGGTAARADNGAAGAPCRYLLCFGGFALGADNDSGPTTYVPDTVGPGYDLKPSLAPLAMFGNVKDEITVVSGLEVPVAIGSGNVAPMGRNGGDSFHFHPNPLLTGNRQAGGVFGVDITGPSSDQVVADAIAGDTTFASLTYRVQALFYNQGGGTIDVPRNRDSLAFRQQGSTYEPIVPYSSPRQAYDSLFTGFEPIDPAEAAQRAFELSKRRSVLDFVDRRIGGLMPQLSKTDQARLERHYAEIRDLEDVLSSVPPDQSGECMQLPNPGQDPPLGGEPNNPGHWHVNLGYSDEDARAQVFLDLVHMAFTCDLSRSATLMLTMWQSFMNINPLINYQWNQHQLQHDGSTTQIGEIIAWHMEKFGYLVAKLRDTPEGAGSVLDNCACVFLNEGGHGGDPEFGMQWSSHTTENMACLIAGGAGGLVKGQHIVAPPATNHPVNVLISAMQAVGLPDNSLGEVTGGIPALRA